MAGGYAERKRRFEDLKKLEQLALIQKPLDNSVLNNTRKKFSGSPFVHLKKKYHNTIIYSELCTFALQLLQSKRL